MGHLKVKNYKFETVEHFKYLGVILRGHAVAQWLRHRATNWKVMDSIPDGVTGFFY
jgi:hypothetical protein